MGLDPSPPPLTRGIALTCSYTWGCKREIKEEEQSGSTLYLCTDDTVSFPYVEKREAERRKERGGERGRERERVVLVV